MRTLNGLPWHRAVGLTNRNKFIAEAQAFADAEDMIRRLGVQWAYIVAREHARAEQRGVGAELFPAKHWERVAQHVQRALKVR